MTRGDKPRVLVLTQNYPDNHGRVILTYIHTRNVYYKEYGIEVTVLNFATTEDYIKDGIRVISLNSYKQSSEHYDLLILHAANIRSHLRFLLKYGKRFPKYLFFYHGHEVMRINHDYSKPYAHMRPNYHEYMIREIYDVFKLFVWKNYLVRIINKSYFVFVSNWMHDIFIRNTGIAEERIQGKYSITYNSVSREFETLKYDDTTKKEYDFITIRANLDGSKYAVDIVNRIAKNTPEGKFLLVGKGELFSHIDKADNITWLNKTLDHSQIVEMLNTAKFALMPTRTDAQGLMMCEMAAFGIPVITSDIPVCHEVFNEFSNAYYINNEKLDLSLSDFINRPSHSIKDTRYYWKNTLVRELNIIRKLTG